MRKTKFLLFWALLAAWPLVQKASDWEWQFSLGPWTLAPWTSPVAREAEKMVGDEALHILAPLLSEFTFIPFSPRIKLNSSGYFFSAGCWRRLAADKFALGFSASYLNFSLPFTVTDEQDIYFQDIQIAHFDIRGQGKINLRTIMLTAQGRWRVFQAGRTGFYTGLGLTLIHFSGNMYLPMVASINSFLGTFVLEITEDMKLAELRAENSNIPAWIMSPALTLSLHYRLGNKSRLFMEINLSQGTFLAVGLALGK
jgi:hypothetical protein